MIIDKPGLFTGGQRCLFCALKIASENGYRSQREMERKILMVKIAARDKIFRAAIIAEDDGCVISGETLPSILNSAHILEVKNKGSDLSNNGIILRKNLLALHDTRFFSSEKNGTTTIAPGLNEDYIKLLNNASSREKLKAACFRVSDALEIRRKLDKKKIHLFAYLARRPSRHLSFRPSNCSKKNRPFNSGGWYCHLRKSL